MRKKSLRTLIEALLQPSRWEAPDQNFIGHRDNLVRSMVRYQFVCDQLLGNILEIGCGRGYGLDIIENQKRYIGIDLSYPFLVDARKKYTTASFVNASGDLLPFSNHLFDGIVAFEVIEHIPDPHRFFREIVRVLRRPCLVAISTPNRLISSEGSNTPLNRFHYHEYTINEFYNLLIPYFSSITIWGQSENKETITTSNRLINSVPEKWKYYIPAFLNGILSTLLRKPLSPEHIIFRRIDLDTADTFIAFCNLE
jgi:SAM-dependent methyltransferase